VDTVGGDLYLGDAAEGEEEFDEIFGRLVGGLFDDVGDGVSDGGLEGDSAGVESGEVDADELAWLEGGGHTKMVALGWVKCKKNGEFTPEGAEGAEDAEEPRSRREIDPRVGCEALALHLDREERASDNVGTFGRYA
jgi:hypothetical protein